jgi:hypothetical protein
LTFLEIFPRSIVTVAQQIDLLEDLLGLISTPRLSPELLNLKDFA